METDPLLLLHSDSVHNVTKAPPCRQWRWIVLSSFSLFSFSSALMWDTFAPCLYIFVDYYFDTTNTVTVNAIHSLSLIYMLLYPIAIQSTFTFFEEDNRLVPGSGLKRGVLIGAVLNMLAGCIRWLGASSPTLTGFAILFTGQTVAAIAQAFMLAVPPRLAGAWFPENEINLATSIAVSANNLGVAAGCVWTPLAVKATTMMGDIPRLMLMQFGLTVISLVFIILAFRYRSPYTQRELEDNQSSYDQAAHLWKQSSFLYMLASYGIIMGSQCAIITLLAQILLPAFGDEIDETFVGWLGFVMLASGCPASVAVGIYLDKTGHYRMVCNSLFIVTALSVGGIYLATDMACLSAVTISCVIFGLASYAIAPAIFQYASELYYPISEIIPTGYLFTVGNVGGVLFAAIMGWSEDQSARFSMRIPMLGLVIVGFVGIYFITKVQGPLKRTLNSAQLPQETITHNVT